MKNVLKLSLLLLFIVSLVSCDKIAPENSNSTITLIVENETEFDFEDFAIYLYDQETESEILQEFGSIDAGGSVEINYDNTLQYMHYGDVDEYMHFGNTYSAVLNGKEYVSNNGWCGTGLIFDETDKGTFITTLKFIDEEYSWIGVEQSKL